MKKTLGEICDISSGIVTRRKEAVGEIIESYKLLTLKSIEEDGYINKELLDDFDSNEILNPKYITSEGDVIVRLSQPYTSVYIDIEDTGIVVSSHCLILRGFNNGVSPRFMALYINSDLMKKRIGRFEYGSAVKMLKAAELREMAINIPPLSEQKEISDISKLFMEEKKLLSKMIMKRDIQLKGIQQRYFGGNR